MTIVMNMISNEILIFCYNFRDTIDLLTNRGLFVSGTSLFEEKYGTDLDIEKMLPLYISVQVLGDQIISYNEVSLNNIM